LPVADSSAEVRSDRDDIFSRRTGVARARLPIRDIHGSCRSNVARQRQQVGFRHRFGDSAFLVLYLLPSSPMGHLHCQHLLLRWLGNRRLPKLLRSCDRSTGLVPVPPHGSFGANLLVQESDGDPAVSFLGPLRAAWLWLKADDLIPDKGQFRWRFPYPLSNCCPATIFRDILAALFGRLRPGRRPRQRRHRATKSARSQSGISGKRPCTEVQRAS
jgi:hypothetical protein